MSEFQKTERIHGGLRGEPAPDVGGGIRYRGKARKLTGYFVLRNEIVDQLFSGAPSEARKWVNVLVQYDDKGPTGVIRLEVAGEEDHNAQLRRQGASLSGWLIETGMIPLPPDAAPVRRSKADYALIEGQSITITAPWLMQRNRKAYLEQDPLLEDVSSSFNYSPE